MRFTNNKEYLIGNIEDGFNENRDNCLSVQYTIEQKQKMLGKTFLWWCMYSDSS